MVKDMPDYQLKVTEMKYNFKPSDVLRRSDDEEESTTATTYVELKMIEFDPEGTINKAKLRIKFDLKRAVTGKAYAQIYRNGVAIGTERWTQSFDYVTYTEDIHGWSVGDEIQLWAKGAEAGGAEAWVRNFRVYADIEEMTYAASW